MRKPYSLSDRGQWSWMFEQVFYRRVMEDHRHTTPHPTGVVAARPQHVYVCVTGVWGQEANPGVLLEWRRTHRNRAGWEALCIYVRVGGATGWAVHQGWVDAAHVKPVRTAPGP